MGKSKKEKKAESDAEEVAEAAGSDSEPEAKDGKDGKKDSKRDSSAAQYVSPIADPLIGGKLRERAIKLVKKSVAFERSQKSVGGKKGDFPDNKDKDAKDKDKNKVVKKTLVKRCIKRGVTEVNKSLRKGVKGMVFLASDVHPIDIIAHIPILCEKKDILYVYLCPKSELGMALRSHRPTSALMVTDPEADYPTVDLFEKVQKSIKKIHPYF